MPLQRMRLNPHPINSGLGPSSQRTTLIAVLCLTDLTPGELGQDTVACLIGDPSAMFTYEPIHDLAMGSQRL